MILFYYSQELFLPRYNVSTLNYIVIRIEANTHTSYLLDYSNIYVLTMTICVVKDILLFMLQIIEG